MSSPHGSVSPCCHPLLNPDKRRTCPPVHLRETGRVPSRALAGGSGPALLAVLALLLKGSVSSAAETQTGWTEVQTAHITVKSDLGAEETRRAALAVELTRSALLAAGWPGAKLLQPERVEVIVFAGEPDFHRYFPREVLGILQHGVYPPTAFLFGPPEKWEKRPTLALENTTSVLKHELVHHLAAFIYRREPKWFAEGLAQYLETVRISEDGKTATLGDVNLDAMSGYSHVRQSVADVLAWSGKADEVEAMKTAGLYGTSWLLVHWLNNVHPEEFARYQTFLAKGIEPDKAWKIVFPTLATTDIDVQIRDYAQHGDYHYFVVPIPEPEGTVKQRPMTSAEVHATRARAALAGALTVARGAAQLKDARSEIDAALAEDPGNVRALYLKLGLVKPEERLALARRASETHPEDGLGWQMLGEFLPSTPETWDERATAYQKALALLPDDPTAFNNLAWMYLEKGAAKQALPLATSAVRMAPWEAAYLDTLAAALADLHRCSEAIATQSRALDVLPEDTSPSRRAAYLKRLTDFQKKCAEAPPLPATPEPTPTLKP